MSVRNRAQLASDIATNIIDNTSGYVTPLRVRNVLTNMVDSSILQGEGSGGTTTYTGSLDKLTTVSTNTTASTSYNFYLIDTVSSDVTMSINPATFYSSSVINVLNFKKITNNFYAVNILPSTGSIDGASSYTMTQYNESLTIVSNGSNLYVI